MIYLRFLVSPAVNHPQFYEIGKAYANILVNVTDKIKAEALARFWLADNHWEIESLGQIAVVRDRADFQRDKELARCFDLALAHGLFCEFAACPPGGEISDADLPGGLPALELPMP